VTNGRLRSIATRWLRAAILGLAGLAVAATCRAASPGEACRDQAAIAEQAAGIPKGLLLAIGKRESGVADGGSILPWPWAVNQDGAGRYLDSQAAAVAFVREVRAHGARSIDVGCFQISLLYHPEAFGSLDQAFDPALNAAYAARFLASLRASTGSWDAAVAAYHSADAVRGVTYRQEVMATWHGRPDLLLTGFRGADASPAGLLVMGVHVWIPAGVAPVRLAHRPGGLPNVITPSAYARGP
jgi:hypothetical protein